MLKRFYFSDGSGFVLVGIACDIRRMYKRMMDKCDYTGLYPVFSDFPRFKNNNLFYGIVVEDRKFSVVSQDIIIDWLMDDVICSWMVI